MEREDAIRMVKRAIVLCDLRDLPKTKASMTDLLDCLTLPGGETEETRPPRRRLH